MQLQVVTFSAVKDGNAPDAWQDGAYGGVTGGGTGTARFVVLDGATGSFDAVRWVDQLVTSFVPPPGADRPEPRLEPAAIADDHLLSFCEAARNFRIVGALNAELYFAVLKFPAGTHHVYRRCIANTIDGL